MSARRGIIDMFLGKKGSYLGLGSSPIPATAKKGKKALLPVECSYYESDTCIC